MRKRARLAEEYAVMQTGHWSSPLACRFMAELLGRTMEIVDEVAYQRELQSFLDELKPWVHPGDCPGPRAEFTLFSRLEMDEVTEMVSVVLTSEGQAFFRAWLQRQGINPAMSMS